MYHAVALRIPMKLRLAVTENQICSLTSVITIIRGLFSFTYNGRLAGCVIVRTRVTGRTLDSRVILVVKDPYPLVICLDQGFETIVQREGSMSNFLHNSLEENDWGIERRRLYQVHLENSTIQSTKEEIFDSRNIPVLERHWYPARCNGHWDNADVRRYQTWAGSRLETSHRHGNLRYHSLHRHEGIFREGLRD